MIRLAIIGTSGRSPNDLKMLTKAHMEWMVNNVKFYIREVLKISPEQIILVSGGSAWADHIAVQLYLGKEFAGIELYLPSRFDAKHQRYINTHEGRKLNALHKQCQEKTDYPVFQELASTVSSKKCKVTIQRGFLPRNTLVARNCDYLIAFTFSKTDTPENGGTLDTWSKTKHQNKIHFSLHQCNPSDSVKKEVTLEEIH